MSARARVLAISGSLRRGASNTALLEAVRRCAPPGIAVYLYRRLGDLPHFNPDLDAIDRDDLPPAVAELRALVGQADAVLLSTPEYAHGLPGSFKNLLDWLVGSTEFPGKPVAVIAPTSRSTHAQAQLREILATMSATLIDPVPIVVALPRRDMDAAEIAADEQLSTTLRSVLDDIVAVVRSPAAHSA